MSSGWWRPARRDRLPGTASGGEQRVGNAPKVVRVREKLMAMRSGLRQQAFEEAAEVVEALS